MKGVGAGALAVVILILASVPVLAGTDLGSLLAPPPSSDWVEYDPAPDVVEGPFTAHSYADWVQRYSSSPVATEAHLNLDGFVAGYGREWEQRGTRDYLRERVFQFRTAGGATTWYSGLRVENETSTYFINDISGLDGIPNSFGVLLRYATGSGREARVEFVKGDLMFIVHIGSDTSDLSSQAVRQAQVEYDGSPKSAGNVVIGTDRTLMVAGGIVIGGVLLISTLILVIVIMVRPWRGQAVVAVPPGAQVSPDGNYWWDGTAWRPTGHGVSPGS